MNITGLYHSGELTVVDRLGGLEDRAVVGGGWLRMVGGGWSGHSMRSGRIRVAAPRSHYRA